MRWVTLTAAPDQLTAEMWRDLLVGEGIPAQVRAGDTASYLGVSATPCRLLVPADREAEAREVLTESLGFTP